MGPIRWPWEQQFSQPPAIVFSSMVTGLAAVRALGKAGIPVIALDPNPLAPGLHSRFATGAVVCPDPLRSEKDFVEFLVALGQSLGGKGVLFPTTDTYVPVLARARSRLEPIFYLPPYDGNNVRPLTNKWAHYQVLQAAGVSVPRTWYPHTLADLQKKSREFSYPVVLKPVHSRPFFVKFGRKLSLVQNLTELTRQFQEYLDAGHPMIVQQFIPGDAAQHWTIHACTDNGGQALFALTTRMILLEPPLSGNGLIQQQVDHPEVEELARSVIKALDFRGYICNPQFKYDVTDRRWKLLEVNPRPSMSMGLCTASGFNIFQMAYEQFLGRPISQPSIRPRGVSWVMDLTTPNGYRRLAAAFLARRRQHLHHVTYAFFAADDPQPFLYALMVAVQEARNKLALGRMSG